MPKICGATIKIGEDEHELTCVQPATHLDPDPPELHEDADGEQWSAAFG